MSDDELRQLLEGLRQENVSGYADTRRHFDEKTAAVEARFDQKTADLKQQFHVTAEGLRSEFRLLAETVVRLDQRIGRFEEKLTETIERTALETQAMIRFSHADLDRRVHVTRS